MTSYLEEDTNRLGKKYTTRYCFDTAQDLELAAEYIVDYGMEAFSAAIESGIQENVSNERNTSYLLRTATPSVINRTVSGNGGHTISGIASGLVLFDTLGEVEYIVELSYRVTVSNNKFTSLNNVSFNISGMSGGGSWGETSFPSHCLDEVACVSANYTITKEVPVDINGIGVTIKAETEREVFAIIAELG